MKKILVSVQAVMLGACSSSMPSLPIPEGSLVAVNGDGLPLELVEYIRVPVAVTPPARGGSGLLVQSSLADQVSSKINSLNKEGDGKQAVTSQPGTSGRSVKAPPAPIKNLWPVHEVKYGESPLDAIKRWASDRGYVHVITDTSPELERRLSAKSGSTDSYGDTFDVSLAKLSEKLAKEGQEYRIFASKIEGEKTIVIHDKGTGLSVQLFEIKTGSLKDNAIRLAHKMGLQTEPNSWADSLGNPKQYEEGKIVIYNDPLVAFDKLLGRYSVVAYVVQGTNKVYFGEAK